VVEDAVEFDIPSLFHPTVSCLGMSLQIPRALELELMASIDVRIHNSQKVLLT
jgi:hypothetical protein